VTATALQLANPCLTCDGPVTYSGRGRRPLYCSPECRRTDRTAYERTRARREAASARQSVDDVDVRLELAKFRRRERIAREGYRLVQREEHEWLRPDATAAEVARLSRDLSDEGRDGREWRRNARPRSKDPAAQWLAENHPKALPDFGPDV
jgi:hypothetical protein